MAVPWQARVRRRVWLSTAAAVIVALSLTLQGCAGLILREEDSGAVKTGKVATRVLLGLATVGMSEVFIEVEKDRERENMLIPVTEVVRQKALRRPRSLLLIGTNRRAMEAVRINVARQGVQIQESPLLDEQLAQEEGQRERSLDLQAEARRVGQREGVDDVIFVVTGTHRVSLEAISVETGDLLWIGRASSPVREDEPGPGDDVIERLTNWAFSRVWCADGAWNDLTGCQEAMVAH
jgi:hypothetical protein